MRRGSLLITRAALIATVLAAAAFTVHELHVLLTGAQPVPIPLWAAMSQQILAVSAGALALVLILKSFGRAETRALAAHLSSLSLNYATIVRATFSGGIPYEAVFAFAGGFAVSAFLYFTLLFPARLVVGDVLDAPGRRPFGLRALQAGIIERPTTLWWLAGVYALLWLTFALAASSSVAVGASLLMLVLFVLGLALGLSFLRIGYRKADPENRRKILWILQGYFLAFLAIVALLISAGLSYLTGSSWFGALAIYLWFGGYSAAVLMLLACYMIAIFYSGLFDPALTLRKTAVYGLLAIVLTIVFAGVESAVSATVVARFGLPNAADTWIGGGVVALLFGPVRDKLDLMLRPYFTDASGAETASGRPERQG